MPGLLCLPASQHFGSGVRFIAFVRPAIAAVLLALSSAAAVTADEPTIGDILVPVDHVIPGETFPVAGYDLEGESVTIQLAGRSTVITLGTARVAADGTVETSVEVPATFPLGYAELIVTADSGDRWTTVVLVGDRPEGPGRVAAGQGPIDQRTFWWLLLAVGVVIVLAAGASFLRARPVRAPDPD